MAVDPLETGGIEAVAIEARLGAIQPVEIPHQLLHAPVWGPLEQFPGQLPLVTPFPRFRQLTAHEQQLGAGVGEEIGVQQAQVGKTLPLVPRHLAQQGILAVHHLIVGERQQEIFGKGVHQAEGELIVVVLPVHRLVAHVIERVVHPAHIPLDRKPQPPHPGGPGDLGPCGGLLGDGQGARVLAVGQRIELPQEVDGFEVLPAAVAIGLPLARLARVIQVEHGGHRVHPQAVQVKLLQPVVGAGQQEVLHLVAAVIENERPPVGVLAPARILVLIQGGAVKPGQGVGVSRKMRGHPIQDHPDAATVEVVDKKAEVIGAAETLGRSEITRGLVAPGVIERVLGDR